MTKLRKSLSAHAVALAVGVALVAMPGMAAISPDDTTAISSSISTAISGATASGPAAIVDAIKAAAETALKEYGAADAQEVATKIIADALADGATPQEVGQAMAEAALDLGAPFSLDIADAIGASGDSETLVAFDAAVEGSSDGAELATEANAHLVHGGTLGIGDVEVGGGVTGAGFGVTGAGSGSGGNGCLNPSCT